MLNKAQIDQKVFILQNIVSISIVCNSFSHSHIKKIEYNRPIIKNICRFIIEQSVTETTQKKHNSIFALQ